jgi:hypothetical protein
MLSQDDDDDEDVRLSLSKSSRSARSMPPKDPRNLSKEIPSHIKDILASSLGSASASAHEHPMSQSNATPR